MSIRDGILRVLAEYASASQAKFTKHPLADFIRDGLCDAVAEASGEGERLIFKGSAGQSRWARGPWVGIFNRLITTGAQRGYYPCYLFREDMRGVYLSLNQGMTEAKTLYRSDAKTALRARAENYRAMLGGQMGRFPLLQIDLAPSAGATTRPSMKPEIFVLSSTRPTMSLQRPSSSVTCTRCLGSMKL